MQLKVDECVLSLIQSFELSTSKMKNHIFNLLNGERNSLYVVHTIFRHYHGSKTALQIPKSLKGKPTQQWNLIKQRYPSHLIFFRFGAFYELLNKDAIIAGGILNIRVNKLGRAGFPYHSIQNFVPKLINSGHKIAVVEETKIVRTHKPKSQFRDREVIALLSPSNYHLFINNNDEYDDNQIINNSYNPCIVSITNQENKYLSSPLFDSSKFRKLNKNPEQNDIDFTQKGEAYFGLCIMDTNVGKIEISHSTKSNLIHDLSRINPSEILLCSTTASQMLDIVNKMKELYNVTLSDEVINDADDDEDNKAALSVEYDEIVEHVNWNHNLRVCCDDTNNVQNNIRKIMDSYCDKFSSKLQLSATLLLMLYLKECKVRVGTEFVHSLKKYDNKDIVFMDSSTRRALEITHSLYDNNHFKSLIHCLDKTNTAMGRRLLKQRLSSPITDVVEIEKRVKL